MVLSRGTSNALNTDKMKLLLVTLPHSGLIDYMLEECNLRNLENSKPKEPNEVLFQNAILDYQDKILTGGWQGG